MAAVVEDGAAVGICFTSTSVNLQQTILANCVAVVSGDPLTE